MNVKLICDKLNFMKFRRVFLIVLDSVGVGELPDADRYNDRGSNTLGNLARAVGGLNLKTLGSLGLGCIIKIEGLEETQNPRAFYGKMAELSKGKDTTVGHWELMGVVTEDPFPTFKEGFPEQILSEIKHETGVEFIGNYPASGTEIIKELGEEHIKTRKPILYTSQDSVFQIAAHEDIMRPAELYALCESARKILNKYRVARVIARPFAGSPGNFYRTSGRRDFSLPPPEKCLLNILVEKGHSVIGIGKIGEIFANRGFTDIIHTTGNKETMEAIRDAFLRVRAGFVLANLVDFDMLYGHRNNPKGYAKALEEFDQWLSTELQVLKKDDLLIITADHGNDPTTPSTDHSREYVPILVFSPAFKSGGNLGIRKTFADVGQTICENFTGTPLLKYGESFLDIIDISNS